MKIISKYIRNLGYFGDTLGVDRATIFSDSAKEAWQANGEPASKPKLKTAFELLQSKSLNKSYIFANLKVISGKWNVESARC